MDWFWLLYDLESEAKEQSLTGDALLASRRAQQQPVWDQMRAELDAVDDRTEQVVLPKSDLRKALNYVRNHWTELTRYLDDAELLLDNNQCEQLMREVSIGRKNWLFAGSLAGVIGGTPTATNAGGACTFTVTDDDASTDVTATITIVVTDASA